MQGQKLGFSRKYFRHILKEWRLTVDCFKGEVIGIKTELSNTVISLILIATRV